jgi:Flp pilus assembly protein TadG
VPTPERDDRGQVSVLIVGFAVVLILAVGVVVDASSAYLQRQSLDNLADGAALAGADEVRGDPLYTGGLGERVPIDRRVAAQAVRAYLNGIDAYADHPGLRFQVTVRDQSVVVRVSSPLDLPITVGGTTRTTVSATGSAAVIVED